MIVRIEPGVEAAVWLMYDDEVIGLLTVVSDDVSLTLANWWKFGIQVRRGGPAAVAVLTGILRTNIPTNMAVAGARYGAAALDFDRWLRPT